MKHAITGERVELASIPVLGIAVQLIVVSLPGELRVGDLMLAASALLLAQSLVRDLWLLARARRTLSPGPPRVARCLCVESTVGAAGVVAGLVLLGAGVGPPVVMDAWTWSALVTAVLAVGFVLKDYVVQWSPWRIGRDPDHVNIVFTWKR